MTKKVHIIKICSIGTSHQSIAKFIQTGIGNAYDPRSKWLSHL